MNLYQANEACPGCGVFFEVAAELSKVDFTGKEFNANRDNSE